MSETKIGELNSGVFTATVNIIGILNAITPFKGGEKEVVWDAFEYDGSEQKINIGCNEGWGRMPIAIDGNDILIIPDPAESLKLCSKGLSNCLQCRITMSEECVCSGCPGGVCSCDEKNLTFSPAQAFYDYF